MKFDLVPKEKFFVSDSQANCRRRVYHIGDPVAYCRFWYM